MEVERVGYPIDTTFHRRYTILLDMLRDRGYELSKPTIFDKVSTLPTTLAELQRIYRSLESFHLILAHSTDPQLALRVVFLVPESTSKAERDEDKQLSTRQIDALAAELDQSPHLQRLIILSNHRLSPPAASELAEKNATPQIEATVQKHKYYLEYFMMGFFDANPIRHRLQPKYRLLPEKELDAMLGSLSANPNIDKRTILQQILVTDPVARYYGMREADALFVLQKVPSKSVNIRYCIMPHESV